MDCTIRHRDKAIRATGDGCHITTSYWQGGWFYEEALLDHFADHHPVQRTVVDVGANIGNHSLFFLEFLQVERLVAVEPTKTTAALLRKNLERYPNAEVVEIALSDAPGVGRMRRSTIIPGDNGSYILCEDGDSPNDVCRTEVTTLDALGLENVTLLKVDAEWFDVPILKGGMETIRRDRPVIIVELNCQELLNECIDLLAETHVPRQQWYSGGMSFEFIPIGMEPCAFEGQDPLATAIHRGPRDDFP